ncbi:hypothetical protein SDJN03_27915, partial [Cucurbita argyrosperma subsp. sororia]
MNLIWSTLKSFIYCLLGFNGGSPEAAMAAAAAAAPSPPTGPEAAMVAAAKHFSSAHKLRNVQDTFGCRDFLSLDCLKL